MGSALQTEEAPHSVEMVPEGQIPPHTQCCLALSSNLDATPRKGGARKLNCLRKTRLSGVYPELRSSSLTPGGMGTGHQINLVKEKQTFVFLLHT